MVAGREVEAERPPLIKGSAEILRDLELDGRRVAVIHPPDYALRELYHTLISSQALARDLGAAGDPELTATLAPFAAALELDAAGFCAAAAAWDGAALTGVDRYERDYLRRWSLPPPELALYRAARRARATLVDRLAPRLRQAVAAERASPLTIPLPLVTHAVDGLRSAPRPDDLVVDADVHLTAGSGVCWPSVRDELALTRAVFARYGVVVNVRLARTLRVPPGWHDLLQGVVHGPPPPSGRGFYAALPAMDNRLSDEARHAYEAIVDRGDHPERRLHLVFLRHGRSQFYTDDPQPRALRDYPVGGLSFPPYSYGPGIARDYRGLIGLFGVSRSTFAVGLRPTTLPHEIAHNLVNASHEGYRADPAFESWDGGSRDLLLYGFGADIPAGEAGRWQRERLRASPFLYRVVDGQRRWNPDYQRDGWYDDPLYGSHVAPDPPRG